MGGPHPALLAYGFKDGFTAMPPCTPDTSPDTKDDSLNGAKYLNSVVNNSQILEAKFKTSVFEFSILVSGNMNMGLHLLILAGVKYELSCIQLPNLVQYYILYCTVTAKYYQI